MWESIQEWVYPMSLTQLKLSPNSYLRAAQVLAAAGAASPLQMIGAWQIFAPDSETGTGTNYLLTPLYHEGFEPPRALGDIVGQDTWVALQTQAGNLMAVENSEVIAGTQSLRWENPALNFPAVYVVNRRMVPAWVTAGTYRVTVSFECNIPTANQYVYAASMDSTSINVSWIVSYALTTSGMRGVTFRVGGTVVTYQALNLAVGPHVVTVDVSPTQWIISVDGNVIGTYNGPFPPWPPDRILTASSAGISPTWGPYPSGVVMDDLDITALGWSYDPASRLLTLGQPLPSIAPVYVSYKSSAAAVRAALIPFTNQGGWLDTSKYDLDGEGM